MAKAGPGHRLTVAEADGEYFISCGHEMTKAHFISFVAVLTGDTLLIKKLYPEWAMPGACALRQRRASGLVLHTARAVLPALRPGTPPQGI